MVKLLIYREVTAFLCCLNGLLSVGRTMIFAAKCTTSIQGAVLQHHAYKSLISTDFQDCYYLCRNDAPCQSINFYKDQKSCQLNKRTANEKNPLKSMKNNQVFYFENPFRAPLGYSINAPAFSCQEIKESFSGAHSGRYWLEDPSELGKAVNAYCNMTIGVRVECTGNPCLNGGTCTYEGSGQYTCLCPPDYGGVHCESRVIGCQIYTNLSTEDRNENYVLKYSSQAMCDCNSSIISGWHRFTGQAGNKMPTRCVPKYRCNTHAPGWMTGSLPSPYEGVVKRTVCFNWDSNCCNWKSNIETKNCGGFYVYNLVKPPTSHLRYCGAS